MTPYLCGPTCGTSDAPLVSFFSPLSEWVIVCVCFWAVCVCMSVQHCFASVWFQGWGLCRNGPLHCLAGRPDPSRSTSITTWNLNVKHGPLLQPFVFLCGSVGLDAAKARKKQSPAISWLVWHGHGYILQHGNATSSWSERVLKDEYIATFLPTSLKLSALLTDWQLVWTQLLVNSCLYLAYLWVDWLISVDGHKVSLQTKNSPSLGFKYAVINLLVFLYSLFCLWHF